MPLRSGMSRSNSIWLSSWFTSGLFTFAWFTAALLAAADAVVTDQVHGARHQVLHYSCVQPIPNLLALAAAGDQIGILQHRKVMRHGRFRHVEPLGQISGGHFAFAEQAEDLAASRIGQRLECFIAVHVMIRCLCN